MDYKYSFYLCLRFFTVLMIFGAVILLIIFDFETHGPNYLSFLFMVIAVLLYKLGNFINKLFKRNIRIVDDHSDVDSVISVISNQATYQGTNDFFSLYQDQHNQSAPSEHPSSESPPFELFPS